jgi:cell division ATPase FtsA
MAVHALLDVGSTKVGALVCSERSGRVRVLGWGVAACSGAAVGAVTDLEATAAAIREAAGIAERRAGRPIRDAYASVAQPHSFEVAGAGAQLIADREALVLSAERAGFQVLDLVPSALASAAATLSAEERALGAALIDLGAGVTNVVVYCRGAVVLTHVIGFGSADLTASIAAHFGISATEAEFLKRNVGSAVPGEDGLVAVPSCARGEGRSIPRRELAQLIEGRLTPMWRSVARVLAGLKLGAGVAITGGGSLLADMHVLAERVLEQPVRRASPFGLGDLPGELQSPRHSTLVGLAQYVPEHAARLKRPSLTWGRRQPAIA